MRVMVNDQDVYNSTTAMQSVQNQIGNTALPTTAQTLTGAIAEHDGDINSLSNTLSNLSSLHLVRIASDSSIRQALIDSPVGISFYESQKATDNPQSGTVGLCIILKLAESGNYSQIWVFAGNSIYKAGTTTSIPASLTFNKINN